MKIGIIGHGYVGSAVAHAYRNDELIIRDPKLKDSASLDKFISCDAIFVCVPSPSTADGKCDSTILESTLKELSTIVTNIPIICKTTAPPTIYCYLQEQYPNIVHAPEFLTAANATIDYINSTYIVLGGDYQWCVRAQTIIQNNAMNKKINIVDIKTASLYKYMMNCYLAAKVTFMNDFKILADKMGVDFKQLTTLAIDDVRIGDTHMTVPGPDGRYGWGGACFPKDVSAILEEAISLDVNFELMDRIESINKRHRRL